MKSKSKIKYIGAARITVKGRGFRRVVKPGEEFEAPDHVGDGLREAERIHEERGQPQMFRFPADKKSTKKPKKGEE